MRYIAKGLRLLPVVALACTLAACGGAGQQQGGGTLANVAPGSVEQFKDEVGDTILFPFDSSTISNEAAEILTRQAFFLSTYPYYSILIEGHTDDRGTREYNLALGQRRAVAVKKFLIAQGVAENQINTVSYGKERPEVSCDDEACWSHNRRAITTITAR